MKMTTKRQWDFLHTETAETHPLPTGEYEVEMRTVFPRGIKREWLCIKGQPYGAALRSWLQWAPGQRMTKDCENGKTGDLIHWNDFEIQIHDDNGQLLDENGQPQTIGTL